MPKLSKFPLSNAFGVSVPRVDAIPDHQFTRHYAQPDAYHFCQDSVILPWVVAHFEAEQMTRLQADRATRLATEPTVGAPDAPAPFRVLDLCAGCGVVGLELLHRLPKISAIDFVEVQASFEPYFRENAANTPQRKTTLHWRAINYDALASEAERETYDLIISNPPYFFADDGKLTAQETKSRCRFFIDSSFESLVRGICLSLKKTGHAYFLAKLGGTHGRKSWDETRLICGMLDRKATIVADIRGTAVVKITAS